MTERRPWTDHPLVQLTRVRYREFFREPEAVFWVFVFPVLLAAGLGIAFRNRAPERSLVGFVGNGPAVPGMVEALKKDSGLVASPMSDSVAVEALRTGDVALIVIPLAEGKVEFRYDDTRPESRSARLLVDDALQRANGRRDRSRWWIG